MSYWCQKSKEYGQIAKGNGNSNNRSLWQSYAEEHL